MSCKHSKVEGSITYCTLFSKNVSAYKCRDCLMKLDNKEDKANEMFEQIFGKGFGK